MSEPENIEVADKVKVIATGQVAKTIGYMSEWDQFLLQSGSSFVPFVFAGRNELELVEKASWNDRYRLVNNTCP